MPSWFIETLISHNKYTWGLIIHLEFEIQCNLVMTASTNTLSQLDNHLSLAELGVINNPVLSFIKSWFSYITSEKYQNKLIDIMTKKTNCTAIMAWQIKFVEGRECRKQSIIYPSRITMSLPNGNSRNCFFCADIG